MGLLLPRCCGAEVAPLARSCGSFASVSLTTRKLLLVLQLLWLLL